MSIYYLVAKIDLVQPRPSLSKFGGELNVLRQEKLLLHFRESALAQMTGAENYHGHLSPPPLLDY